MQKWSFLNAYFKCFRCWLEVSTQSPNSVQSKHTGFKDGTHCIFWQRNTPRYWMKSCIFCELIIKRIWWPQDLQHMVRRSRKGLSLLFLMVGLLVVLLLSFSLKMMYGEKNIDLIAFFKGSSTWCRPWDHRKGKPVSGNPGCRRYLAERFQLRKYSVVTEHVQVSASWRSCTQASWRTREAEEPSVLLTAGCSIFTKYYEDHDGRNIMQIMVEEILCRSWW